jgi:thymidylate kinase
MSETFDLFGSESKLTSIGAREERPVVLPFPTGEADDSSKPAPKGTPGDGHQSDVTSPLIKKLCDTLNAQQISYCHWKSNWKISRWLSGDGDLDLLIHRADAQRFVVLVYGLGFKQAEPSNDRAVPGILNFYGFDSEAGRFVHLHVHYQLVIGHDLTKNYHLPVENIYLEHATRQGLIPLPAREFELIVFVLRMILKYSVLETMWRRTFQRSSTNTIERELEHLEAKIDRARVANLLSRVAPGIDNAFFETCLQSLRAGSAISGSTALRQELQRRLRTFSRRPQTTDALLKIYRRMTRLVRERLFHQPARKRFVDGGLLIAVVGGDGAGKTTTLSALDAWLSKKFVTRKFHVGKPPRSILTLALIVMLRVRRLLTNAAPHPERQTGRGEPVFPGYIQLLRWVSAGRDRCRLYTRARRFASNGGIALCDRYPLPQIQLMEAANIARTVEPKRRNALIRRLLEMERNYYRRIMQPDLLIVLRVDPEIAVRRKTTESEHHVRLRSGELWSQDWEGTNAQLIDAGQPIADVVSQVQSVVWARL